MAITFILGGARSGKSKRAESLARSSQLPVRYVATAPNIAGDDEWQARIAHHQAQRPKEWTVIEEPLLLAELLRKSSAISDCVLIDCLTLWLNNVMFEGLEVQAEINQLCDALQMHQGEVILVSNEVGLGLVPENKLGREFRDAQGFLNQQLGQVANHVEFVAAGLPLRLK
ncbi:MAG: bifunctional adenosylcobinamide kinase/adenosylcobinamide-phosphate guanylyltransferase [Ghiorsea sp.]